MLQTHPSSSPPLPKHIEQDIPCVQCAYNLYLQPLTAHCPECGHPVLQSHQFAQNPIKFLNLTNRLAFSLRLLIITTAIASFAFIPFVVYVIKYTTEYYFPNTQLPLDYFRPIAIVFRYIDHLLYPPILLLLCLLLTRRIPTPPTAQTKFPRLKKYLFIVIATFPFFILTLSLLKPLIDYISNLLSNPDISSIYFHSILRPTFLIKEILSPAFLPLLLLWLAHINNLLPNHPSFPLRKPALIFSILTLTLGCPHFSLAHYFNSFYSDYIIFDLMWHFYYISHFILSIITLIITLRFLRNIKSQSPL